MNRFRPIDRKTAYHPEVMFGLLVYGYATGVFSSRNPHLTAPLFSPYKS